MMTRLIRPCTLSGETFDACDFTGEVVFIQKDVSDSIHQDLQYYAKFFTKNLCVSYTTPLCKCKTELSQYVNKVNYTIQQALNAPVLVTREVLAGLPKDAKTLVAYFVYHGSGDDAIDEWIEAKWDDMREKWKYNSFGIFPVINRDDDSWYIIKSNGCFKTLDYLLQFYTDGTLVNKRKETE